MRIGTGKKRNAETAFDDRPAEAPVGGFAPLDAVVLEADHSGGMPPPPPSTDIDEGERQDIPSDGDNAADDAGPVTAGFPSSTETEHQVSRPRFHDDMEEQPSSADPGAASAPNGDDSVIFFGDTEGSATPSSWIPDEDADLIMPIEPSRLVSGADVSAGSNGWHASNVAPSSSVAAPDEESASTGHDGAPTFDAAAAMGLVTARLLRGLAKPALSLSAFVDDDVSRHVTVTPHDGSVVLLAGSELEGVVAIPSAGTDGSVGLSIELTTIERVPLGIRIPIALVTYGYEDGETLVSHLGGVTVTVRDGALALDVSVDNRVDAAVAGELERALEGAATIANDAVGRHDRAFKAITTDSLGSIRVETESR